MRRCLGLEIASTMRQARSNPGGRATEMWRFVQSTRGAGPRRRRRSKPHARGLLVLQSVVRGPAERACADVFVAVAKLVAQGLARGSGEQDFVRLSGVLTELAGAVDFSTPH